MRIPHITSILEPMTRDSVIPCVARALPYFLLALVGVLEPSTCTPGCGRRAWHGSGIRESPASRFVSLLNFVRLKGGGGGGGGGGGSTSPNEECLYSVLGVPASASPSDIIAGYKKQALKWHPDKNSGSAESEIRFKRITHAKEVLSDPHERAWYDANREQILWRGRRGTGSTTTTTTRCHQEEREEHHDPGLDLLHLFSSSAYSGMHDGEGGFFSVFNRAFDDIIARENQAWQKAGQRGSVPLPPFGHRQVRRMKRRACPQTHWYGSFSLSLSLSLSLHLSTSLSFAHSPNLSFSLCASIYIQT